MKYSRQYWLCLSCWCLASLHVYALPTQVIKVLYRKLADENRFYTIRSCITRNILDRNHLVLVHNTRSTKWQHKKLGRAYPEFVEISEREALDQLARNEKNVLIDQNAHIHLARHFLQCLDMWGMLQQKNL